MWKFVFPQSENGVSTCTKHKVISSLVATVPAKEYISVIEGTAPPCVFQTFDSPNLSPRLLCQTVRKGSVLQSGERLGESNVWTTQGGAVPSITDILYILWSQLWVWTDQVFTATPHLLPLSRHWKIAFFTMILSELGTRQYCRDNKTMFSGNKYVCYCNITITGVETPSRHQYQNIFRILCGPWDSITLSCCRCREAIIFSRAQLWILMQSIPNNISTGSAQVGWGWKICRHQAAAARNQTL